MKINRNLLADTFAMVTFSFCIGMAVEIFIGGLSFSQSLHSRTVGCFANIITARPYGLWRDFIFKHCRWDIPFSETIADTIAFVGFQIPLYICILTIAGADLQQIIKSTISIFGVTLISGRPYGVYLSFIRRLWNSPKSVASNL